MKRSVVIIDDHQIFIQGLKIIIESYEQYRVAGEAAASEAAIELIGDVQPDLAIVDLNLGNEDGLTLIKQLKKKYPDLLMIVLSMLDERHYAERALLAGARGYIMKEETAEMLLKAMDTVYEGKVWLSTSERERYLNHMFSNSGSGGNSMEPLIHTLSDRQLLVLNMMGKGLGTAQISGELGISPKTVEAHKTQLKKKLGLGNAHELRRFAVEWGGKR